MHLQCYDHDRKYFIFPTRRYASTSISHGPGSISLSECMTHTSIVSCNSTEGKYDNRNHDEKRQNNNTDKEWSRA